MQIHLPHKNSYKRFLRRNVPKNVNLHHWISSLADFLPFSIFNTDKLRWFSIFYHHNIWMRIVLNCVKCYTFIYIVGLIWWIYFLKLRYYILFICLLRWFVYCVYDHQRFYCNYLLIYLRGFFYSEGNKLS